MDPVNFEEKISNAEKGIQKILENFEKETNTRITGIKLLETQMYYEEYLTHLPTLNVEIYYERLDRKWGR
jgi:hypothetical protein